jgi:uncharacterized membrane protein SirB2
MILGLSFQTYTLIHTVISLIGIASGLIVLYGMIAGKPLDVWTPIFLASTVLTSVTGFGFPFTKLLPSHVVGIISLAVLAVAIIGLYVFRLSGAWRWIYIACAVFALYLNCFVGVVQAFMKIPALKALAPTQAEPPFLVAQLLLLVVFIVLGFLAVRRFTPAAA